MPKRQSGFTFLELMVTLSIIGVMIALIGVNFQRSDERTLLAEAQRLAMLIEQTHEEALTMGVIIGWSIKESEYRFWRIGKKEKWVEWTNDSFLQSGALGFGVRLERLVMNNEQVKPGSLIIFSPSGYNPVIEITLTLNEKQIALISDPFGKVMVGDVVTG